MNWTPSLIRSQLPDVGPYGDVVLELLLAHESRLAAFGGISDALEAKPLSTPTFVGLDKDGGLRVVVLGLSPTADSGELDYWARVAAFARQEVVSQLISSADTVGIRPSPWANSGREEALEQVLSSGSVAIAARLRLEAILALLSVAADSASRTDLDAVIRESSWHVDDNRIKTGFVRLLGNRKRGLQDIRHRLRAVVDAVESDVPLHTTPIFQFAAARAHYTFNYELDEATRTAALDQTFRRWVKSCSLKFPSTDGEWKRLAEGIRQALDSTDDA